MALYEDLERQNRTPAIPYGSSRAIAATSSESSTEQVVGMIRLAFLTFLLACWIVGAYAGIVFWSFQGSLLGVIASAVLPGIAATSTLSAFATLRKPPHR